MSTTFNVGVFNNVRIFISSHSLVSTFRITDRDNFIYL